MIINLGEQNSLFNQFLSEIRDAEIQTDRMRFRRNMERVGELFAYEISKKLDYEEREVLTPLGAKMMKVPAEMPVITSILRAGMPLHQGLLNYFDQADNGFVSAYRKHNKDGSFEIALEYISCPDLNGRKLVIVDPMLATGASMALTVKALKEYGRPKETHIVTAIASTQGINYLKKHLSMRSVTLWVGAIDDELTAQAYIVPGLGDAGDLAYGSKFYSE